MKRLLTYKEAAYFLSVPLGTLYSWVSLQRVPHIRISQRCVRFDQAALEEWLAERALPGRTASAK
jgi:excisionase family DNA binding protein